MDNGDSRPARRLMVRAKLSQKVEEEGNVYWDWVERRRRQVVTSWRSGRGASASVCDIVPRCRLIWF